MFTRFVGIAVALVILAMCVPCHAVKLENVTTGTLIFEDDFEDDTAGSAPLPSSSPSSAGWFTVGRATTVENATTLPLPGPNEGMNYLEVRDSSNFRLDFSSETTAGDVIHAEWMYYLPSGAEVFNTANPFYFGVSPQLGSLYYDPDNCSPWCNAGHTTFAYDQWQKWEIDYEIGAPMFNFTIDGESQPAIASFPGDWNHIEFVKRSSQPLINNYIDAVLDGPGPTSFEWRTNDSGSWGTSTNWNPTGGPPNTNEDTAVFGEMIIQPTTVTTNVPITVNRIDFNNATNSYAIAGLGSLNLEATSGGVDPQINVSGGSHQFQAVVNLTSNTDVFTEADTTLKFTNELNLQGQTLTKTGGGTMEINNRLGTGGNGTIDCQDGTCGGSGTVGGDLINNTAMVAPGNSPGILTIDGNYTQGSDGMLAIEIGGQTPGEEHDKLVVNGTASLAGTLDVTLINGFTPSNGNAFDILDAGSVTGDFSVLNLPPNFTWDVGTGVLLVGGTGFSDYDDDGTWGLGDLNLVLFNWNEDGASLPPAWMNSRPGAGTLVGLPELNQVLFNWGQPGSLAAVPEPATALGASISLLFLVCLTRRRSPLN